MYKLRQIERIAESEAFTLAELLVTIVIVGTLSSIALPSYLSQMQRTRQSEAAATVSQLQTTLVDYFNEYRTDPSGWSDLNEMSAVMTSTGPASADNTDVTDFDAITLPGGNYTVAANNVSDGQFTFTASPADGSSRNVVACVDLNNGASDRKEGSSDTEATVSELVCWSS